MNTEPWNEWITWTARLIAKVKQRIPVSRGRYDRELALLRLSVNRTIAEEKQQLEQVLYSFTNLSVYSSRDFQRTVRAEVQVTDELIYSMRSPYVEDRLWYEIVQRLCHELRSQIKAEKHLPVSTP